MHIVLAGAGWLVLAHSAMYSDTADELGPTVEPLVYNWSYCILVVSEDDESIRGNDRLP
jgi:hypothetical protein